MVATVTTAAAMLAIDSLPAMNVEPAGEPRTAALPIEETDDALLPGILDETEPEHDGGDRLAFVPPDAVTLLFPELATPWNPDVTIETGSLPDWATETRTAKTPRLEGQATSSPSLSVIPRRTAATSQYRMSGRTRELDARLAQIAPAASERIAEKFKSAKVAWPPSEIALVAIKDEKAMELFARPQGGPWSFVHRYRIFAASGGAGPKLIRGDKQVPEGVYRISFLNPNSRYHVSMRVNYPNTFDRRMAKKDGRRDLGGDIMIHGKKSSAGCLAMGDEAAEELFVLAASIGLPNIELVIAPTDLRRRGIPSAKPGQPDWVPKLYMEVASAMSEFKAPPSSGGSLLSLLGL